MRACAVFISMGLGGLGLALAAGVGGGPGIRRLVAEEGKTPPAAPGAATTGAVLHDKERGVRVTAPKDWKLVPDKGGPTLWTRVASFFDGKTSAEAVFSERKRGAIDAQSLLARVRAEWAERTDIVVTSTRLVEATPTSPTARVVVDGTYMERPSAPKGVAAAVPPPPIAWRTRTTYFLGPGHEYMLYARAHQTHWSRADPAFATIESSVAFDREVDAGPKGAGAYRNDEAGFQCAFPPEYAVTVPGFRNHVVEFVGISDADPALGVFVLPWTGTLEADAKRLVDFYVEDQGGSAESRGIQLGGREALLVEARARVGGRDTIVLLALAKRGNDAIYRVKGTAPLAEEAALRARFNAFLASFQWTRSAR